MIIPILARLNTGSAEYALSDSVPFEASSMYFELSEKITEFELVDELYKE